MADPKNETSDHAAKAGRTSGAETEMGGKVSAGTSVGNIGEAPMPHAQEGAPDVSSAMHESSPDMSSMSSQASSAKGGAQKGGKAAARNQSSQASGQEQGGSMMDKAQNMADEFRQRAEDAYEGATDWFSSTPEPQRRRGRSMGGSSKRSFGQIRGNVQSYVAENPMVVGLAGLAAGLLLGALLPRTRRENQMFGEWADEVRRQGMRYAREATQRGREYVEENLSDEDQHLGHGESEFEEQRPGTNRH